MPPGSVRDNDFTSAGADWLADQFHRIPSPPAVDALAATQPLEMSKSGAEPAVNSRFCSYSLAMVRR